MFKMQGHKKIHNHIANPANNRKKIVSFDPVHLFKSIRNNWINYLDHEKTFDVPTKIMKPKIFH